MDQNCLGLLIVGLNEGYLGFILLFYLYVDLKFYIVKNKKVTIMQRQQNETQRSCELATLISY